MAFNSRLDTDSLNLLASNVNYLMWENRLNRTQVAKITGLSVACINRIANGEMAAPTVNTLKALAEGFNTYWADLVDKDLTQGNDQIDVIVDKVLERLHRQRSL